MLETPFDFYQTERGWIAENQSHTVTVISEVPAKMGRRRRMTVGSGMAEMAAVELLDGTRIYVRQLDNGHVDVTITRRLVNP